MPTPPRPFKVYPFRQHGRRVALLATMSGDVPALATLAAQRRVHVLLNRLRLPAISRVQLRCRDGDEPFLASVDVVLDHRAHIRAVIAANASVHAQLADVVGLRSVLRQVAGSASCRRATALHWRLRRIDLPTFDTAALTARGFVRQQEPHVLHSIGTDLSGRPMYLINTAARAFVAMCATAAREQVLLQPISSFRSVAYQRGLIARKLKRGDTLDAILRVNAAPGFSEHHSGRAIDIGTPGCAALDEAFEHTPAFAWLQRHASNFDFRLSYPRNNPLGVIYEPWHWYYFG